MYESLSHLYYTNEAKWRQECESRFNGQFTVRLPFSIKQFGRRNEYRIFYCPVNDISLLLDNIMQEFSLFNAVLSNVSDATMKAFYRQCVIDEIKSTNDIEGVNSTRREIKLALDAAPNQRSDLRFGGIVDKYLKIVNGESITINSCADIRSLYDDIMSGEISDSYLPDGEIFRKGSVDIVSPTQKILHRGLYPETAVKEAMNKALQILHDEKIPRLVRVGIFHYLFGYIHPFYDGNGRTARFITSCFIAQFIHPIIALRLSIILKNQRKRYYKLFADTDSEINRGDLTPFIIGTLRFILTAIIQTEEVLQQRIDIYRQSSKEEHSHG